MRTPLTASTFREFLRERGDLEVLRVHYCYQIGSTFVNLAVMEGTIISAMSSCDRIKVANLLGPDASNWQRLVNKTSALQSSTLGNLISILSRHEISREDLTYLKWVKAKRDFFIHRFFHRGEWPGELEGGEIDAACRKLLYLEIIFRRASRRIWHIFARSNLMTLHDLGSDGIVMTNLGLFEENLEQPRHRGEGCPDR
jgi:hypothetical protein